MEFCLVWWYRLALFLYCSFSFSCKVSTNCLLALLIIVAIDLLHRDGMSSLIWESLSCRICAASGMGVVSCGDGGHSVCY